MPTDTIDRFKKSNKRTYYNEKRPDCQPD